jgi:hypothetical protein
MNAQQDFLAVAQDRPEQPRFRNAGNTLIWKADSQTQARFPVLIRRNFPEPESRTSADAALDPHLASGYHCGL